MTKSPQQSGFLQALRQEISDRRGEIRMLHNRGLPSAQVSARLATLLDTVMVRLFDQSLAAVSGPRADQLRSNMAVVCLGSHGRRQCSPYSDVDLMFLIRNLKHQEVAEALRPMTQGVFDIGLQLGSSIRKPGEAIQLARDDVVICTSLIDARLLAGDQTLFEEFRLSFEKMARRNNKSLAHAFLESRAKERDQYGESVYLLEPHVKRSRGGLRDLNLLRWLAYVEFGESDPDRLHVMGTLSKFDHHRLQAARDFLLRLRNEMHFQAGTCVDMLDRAEQLRVAGWLELPQRAGLLPVEQFMRDYFRHTNHVWQLVRRREASLISSSSASWMFDPLFTRTVDGEFRVGRRTLGVTPSGLARVTQDFGELLRLVSLAASEGKPLDQPTYSAVLLAAPEFSDELDVAVRRQFYFCLGDPNTVGPFLSLLHELGYLEKLIPAMRHVRCLLQFNQYHKYTVDEHSLQAVREVAAFAERQDPLGTAYREVKDKRLLHLALLIHDLGKGHEGDHSEVGKQIAEDTARLFELDEPTTADLVFLVHKHLMMSLLTFRRDTSDLRLLEGFSRQVGSVERLRMLFVLTCADLAAVGPEVLTDWKRDVLADVYSRTRALLENDDSSDIRNQLSQHKLAVLKALTPEQRADEWYPRQLEALPHRQVIKQTPAQLIATLTRLKPLQPGEADAWCSFQEETKTLECVAGVAHGLGQGVFSRLAGALSGAGLEILSADIDELLDELLLVRYTATDSRSKHEAESERLQDLAQRMLNALRTDQPPRFRNVWGQDKAVAKKKLTGMANEVRIDNSQSEDYTIVEVFTFDRPGLLYALASKVHELHLVIRHARIGTYIDQVVDVFYLTTRDGHKVTSDSQLDNIYRDLMQVIDSE